MDNSNVEDVWKNILNPLFKKTYGEILNEIEISQRVEFIINELKNIDPKSLYKCVLYSDLDFELGKLAIDYRLGFISPEYQMIIRKGESIEIDSLHGPDGNMLRRKIMDILLLINHAVNLCIVRKEKYNIHRDQETLCSDLSGEVCGSLNPIWLYSEKSMMNNLASLNQAFYAAIYNQNPFDGSTVSESTADHIKSMSPIRTKLMELLKSKYPSGIQLGIVRNQEFF